jgi:hypothetical protein
MIPFILTGCYKDQSTIGKYGSIGYITIENIENRYRLISLVDTLKISPQITSSNSDENADNFEYLWTYTSPTVKDTISYSKDLEWRITLAAGSYTVLLRVTNPANGYTVFQTTQLDVGTVFTNGFYFLKETADGNTELDYHTPTVWNVELENLQWTTAFNILEAQLGAPITGAPTSLGLWEAWGGARGYSYIDRATAQLQYAPAIVVMGGRDLKVLRISDMGLIYDHNELFFTGQAPDHKPLRAFYYATGSSVLFFSSTGRFHTSNATNTTGKMGFPAAPAGGVSFSTGAIVGPHEYNWNDIYVFFDELNEQLVFYETGGALIPVQSGSIPHTGIKDRPLFMGFSGWCVFRDAQDPTKRYLYQINNNASNNPPVANRPILQKELINVATAPNFNNAQLYGSHKLSQQIMYGSIGNQLYMYNTITREETHIPLPEVGAGEVITMITHRQRIASPIDRSELSGFLLIATHKDGNYKVYMYKLIGGVPDPEIPPIIVSGQGKVVDTQYSGAVASGHIPANSK